MEGNILGFHCIPGDVLLDLWSVFCGSHGVALYVGFE